MKKCKRCGKWKKLEEFYKDNCKKDGLRYCCKQCDDERRNSYDTTKKPSGRKRKLIEIKNGFKLCSKCGELKPISEFSKDPGQKTGLACRCKDCKRQYYINNKDRIALERIEYHKKYRKRE